MIPNMNFAVGFSAEYGALQNNLFSIQKKLDKTMENLSTGSKVNDMKDDMSGKAIADVLQSWKVGTDEATENIKEFISFTKTAEDALDKLQEILFDMKQAVDRLTGIDNPSENSMAQNELENNLMAYERIVEQTQFKGWKVFDEGFLYADSGNLGGFNSFTFRKFRFAAGRENSMSWDLGIAPKATNMGQVLSYDIQVQLKVSIGAANSSAHILTNFASSGGLLDTSGSAIASTRAIKKGDLIINGIDIYEAAKAVLPTLKDNDVVKLSEGITRVDVLEKAIEYALGGNASVQLVITNGEDLTDSIAKAHLYINTPFEIEFDGKLAGSKASGRIVPEGKQEAFQLVPDSALDYTQVMGVRNPYNDGEFKELSYDGMGQKVLGYLVDSSGKVIAMEEDNDVNTNLSTVNVLGMEQAGDAKVIIEAAIQQVNELRGMLAAYQKQAEHLLSNRQLESNKVEAQVSQLTETDYAKELAKMTKQQIVQQAGVNMLAQKRQMAQLITQLLR